MKRFKFTLITAIILNIFIFLIGTCIADSMNIFQWEMFTTAIGQAFFVLIELFVAFISLIFSIYLTPSKTKYPTFL